MISKSKISNFALPQSNLDPKLTLNLVFPTNFSLLTIKMFCFLIHTSKSKFLQMIIHSMKVHSILQNRRVESNFNKLTEIPFLLYSSMESGIFLIGVFILYIYGILLTLLTTHSATTNHISIIKGNTVNCIVNQVIIKLRLTLFTLHISYSSSLWKSN